MSLDKEKADIADAIAALRAKFEIPVNPLNRGPAPLARFLDECNVLCVTLEQLSLARIAEYLLGERIDPGLSEHSDRANDPLSGFVLVSGTDAYVFASMTEPQKNEDGKQPKPHPTPLGRRRFTVAHELGHFTLHRDRMGRWMADTKESVIEDRVSASTDELERQANRFATELLMPAEVCRAREVEFRAVYKICPRHTFAYYLAAELLVSPLALRFRLDELSVGDE